MASSWFLVSLTHTSKYVFVLSPHRARQLIVKNVCICRRICTVTPAVLRTAIQEIHYRISKWTYTESDDQWILLYHWDERHKQYAWDVRKLYKILGGKSTERSFAINKYGCEDIIKGILNKCNVIIWILFKWFRLPDDSFLVNRNMLEQLPYFKMF